jgi:hypothetical protein
MPSAAEMDIRPQLDADERLLWCGQPRKRIRLQPGDLFVIAMAVGTMWLGFGIMTLTGSLFLGALVAFLGLCLLVHRWGIDALRLRRTWYGVTDRRIIICTVLMGRKVKSVDLSAVKQITLIDNSGGIGTIIFGPAPPWYGYWGLRGWWRALDAAGVSSFQLIDRAGEVYNLILQAQRAAA